MTMQDLLDDFDRLRLIDETIRLGVLPHLLRRLRARDGRGDVGLSADPTQRHGRRGDLKTARELAQIMGDPGGVYEEPTPKAIVS